MSDHPLLKEGVQFIHDIAAKEGVDIPVRLMSLIASELFSLFTGEVKQVVEAPEDAPAPLIKVTD